MKSPVNDNCAPAYNSPHEGNHTRCHSCRCRRSICGPNSWASPSRRMCLQATKSATYLWRHRWSGRRCRPRCRGNDIQRCKYRRGLQNRRRWRVQFYAMEPGKYDLDVVAPGFKSARYHLTLARPTSSCRNALRVEMEVGSLHCVGDTIRETKKPLVKK